MWRRARCSSGAGMGTEGPLECAGKRTVRGRMGVAQADPSFPGNAAVPPGLSPPCASCSVRAQSGRHSKATISMGLLPRAGQQPHSGALCTHRAPQTPWVAHSALPLALETRRAHMCPCHQPPWLIFRATWGTLPRCCQPVLAHGDVVTLTTPTEAA